MDQQLASMSEPLRSMTIEDRKYELFSRVCAKCGTSHLEVWRWSGTSFASYFFPPDVGEDAFVPFVEDIDEQLLLVSADLLDDFQRHLNEVNTPHGIHTDGSFAFRLLEYGRHRIIGLTKLGMMDVLRSRRKPRNNLERAIRLAFELGSAAAEHRVMDVYEDYMWDGVQLSEWREEGLPRARAERVRQGQRTRSAIANASRQLYTKRPDLVRNDMETARAIRALNLPELQKGRGQQVGLDAITKHLRALRAREHGQLVETKIRHSENPL